MVEGAAPFDLRQVGARPDAATGLEPRHKQIDEDPYSPVKARENIRGKIAICLVWTLVGVITFMCIMGAATAVLCGLSGACSKETLELGSARVIVELVLTPLVGLVGAVTGFYYGEKSNAGGDR